MTDQAETRGGAPVGLLSDLGGVEAACVVYLRLWSDGPDAQAKVLSDFSSALGSSQGQKALQSFEDLCLLCRRHGRRPLTRHSVSCKCLGADEACFANFVAAAAMGDREDALLIATLLVRPDVAPLITALAADVGLALQRMKLRAPRRFSNTQQNQTLH